MLNLRSLTWGFGESYAIVQGKKKSQPKNVLSNPRLTDPGYDEYTAQEATASSSGKICLDKLDGLKQK